MRTVVLERSERRYLGALRFVDATSGLPVDAPLSVSATNGRLFRNRSGCWVIERALGLEAIESRFASQPAAVPAMLQVAVSDASGRYLARRAAVALPRDPDPARAQSADSLFRPVEIALYPAPSAPLAANWSVVRASVSRAGSATPLAGALIRVLREGSPAALARAMSDARGEALVAVRGVPMTIWEAGPGAVVATEISASLELVFDPAAQQPPDPDDIERRRDTLLRSTTPVMLAAGRSLALSLSVAVP
jgi:hypothetical protein